ncbi:MAG: AbrB/MazE/SpoVT family DNA-binding domain-containing protein [archaeon]|nr:AbrB/MazE/SpoVT family DNA-binding domain-containing protein [archaeon]
METVTLSSKFQIVIPKKTRGDLNLKAGQKLVVIEKGNSIELVKIGPLKEAKGLIRKTSTKDLRDHSERFD